MRASGIAALAVVSAALMTARPAQAQNAPVWDRLQMLIGTWPSAGDTQLGDGEGSASFTRELDGHTVIRRSYATYKTGPQAGTRHDDLMVIYRDAPDGPPLAIYFDSEGHVIRYAVTAPDDNSVVFQSDAAEPGPRYRLSYVRKGPTLEGKFEIAMPGGDFKTYLSWTSTQR